MAKPKPVNWELIEEPELYDFVEELVTKYHGGDEATSIEGVNYVIMWRHNVKQDADNYILLADVSKSSDKMRELRPHDVVIGINKDAWSILDDQQKKVVIDSQLERIAVCVDKNGDAKEDDRSRNLYRLRRLEVMDDHTMQRRHSMTIHEVQEYVFDKFNTGDAEEGSYVAEQLNPSIVSIHNDKEIVPTDEYDEEQEAKEDAVAEADEDTAATTDADEEYEEYDN